jgi:hypothetical protein
MSRPSGARAGNGDAVGGSTVYVPSGPARNGAASMTALVFSGP